MFNPTKEVPKLELCKKLKEIGYPQKGIGLYWVKWYEAEPYKVAYHYISKDYERWIDEDFIVYADPTIIIKAPTLIEMVKLLPDIIVGKHNRRYYLKLLPHKDDWKIIYENVDSVKDIPIYSHTFIDKVAEMLIWLAENGYITFKEV